MVLAGKKKTVLKSETSKDLVCPKCNSKNTTKISIFGIYKHLVHIPFISGGKSGKSICTHCQETYKLSNMPATIKLVYYELKETTKTPIWFFSGLIVVKVLILLKIFSRYI
ncbi:hypothetical protein [Lutibacter sp.]|uniref:hypothetical protein n=1 Tax=Lutibacter sp. TaxID=1925666 RepID=UPI0035631CF9